MNTDWEYVAIAATCGALAIGIIVGVALGLTAAVHEVASRIGIIC